LLPVEVVPGVRHWEVRCDRIGAPLGSYLLDRESGEGGATLIDPALPEDEELRAGLLNALRDTWRVSEIILTTRAHRREVPLVAGELGAPILTHELVAPDVESDRVRAFGYEEALPAGLRSLRVDGTAPGECALYRTEGGKGQLFVGDALIHLQPRGLAVLPEDHASDIAALRESVRALLDLEFDQLFPGHGPPVLEDAARLVQGVL
jgi:glyoxylase-like metal-dependent hydrolase (beta-lactamase superfamily II)